MSHTTTLAAPAVTAASAADIAHAEAVAGKEFTAAYRRICKQQGHVFTLDDMMRRYLGEVCGPIRTLAEFIRDYERAYYEEFGLDGASALHHFVEGDGFVFDLSHSEVLNPRCEV